MKYGYFANKTEDASLLHEFGHRFYNLHVKNIAKSQGIAYNESEYIVRKSIYQKIENMGGKQYVESIIGYAMNGHKQDDYSEIIAELYTIEKELGVELTNPRLRLMFIDEEAAAKLYKRYYGG